ncbi:hypothetical protein LGK97_14165 [Clostridium sp. CS001]|uniref:hypothetical protein n=1 Tax=Clostridium sp. CS001 TaxID=2880648 RepID=UPI001CF510C9|nr:hypothetical protein [Clostridium sp. CS001]MCB2290888.1 hypothetical protein [Clostridium sp. CS001]
MQSDGQAYNVTHTEVVTWSQLVETAMKVVNNNLFYYFRAHLTEKYELLWIKNFKLNEILGRGMEQPSSYIRVDIKYQLICKNSFNDISEGKSPLL